MFDVHIMMGFDRSRDIFLSFVIGHTFVIVDEVANKRYDFVILRYF